ncbi:hypothetical protein C6A85_15800, partial [Mycobacterium sp. ITM-2017-0098]
SASTITNDANGVSEEFRTLIDDSGPLLDSQAETTDAIKTWARTCGSFCTTCAVIPFRLRAHVLIASVVSACESSSGPLSSIR